MNNESKMGENMDRKEILRQKRRIVIKVGTTTVTYEETGNINLEKLEKFVRILINLRNKGMEVIVVSSGAVGVGKTALGLGRKPETAAEKQACAAGCGSGRPDRRGAKYEGAPKRAAHREKTCALRCGRNHL